MKIFLLVIAAMLLPAVWGLLVHHLLGWLWPERQRWNWRELPVTDSDADAILTDYQI